MNTQRDKRMRKGRAFGNLCAALNGRECAVCELVERDLSQRVGALFGELCNDPPTRKRLVAGGGFCYRHARTIERLQGHSLEVALVYEDLLGAVLARVEAGALSPGGVCPLCEEQQRTEELYLDVFLAHFSDPELQAAFRASAGFCLAHTAQVVERCRLPDVRAALLAHQRERLESLRTELRAFLRKQDYRFSGEGFGGEGDSWRRATRVVRW